MNIGSTTSQGYPQQVWSDLPPLSGSAETPRHTVSPQTLESTFLQSDLRTFKDLARGWTPNANIVVSPLLVAGTENLTRKIMHGVEVNDSGDSELNWLVSDESSRGIHVLSKKKYADTALQKMGIPHTPCDKLMDQGYAQSTRQLNDRIRRDTGGMIADLISPRTLENPNLAFHMATWLFQDISWSEPLKPASSRDFSYLCWDNKRQPNITWMQSARNSSLISRTKISEFDFISIPISKTGYKTIFVKPPIRSVTEEEIEEVLTQGMSRVISNYVMSEVQLLLPKFHLDCEIKKNYFGDEVSAIHRTALSIDEKGARVAEATSKMMFDGIVPTLAINRPFYFVMIDRQKLDEPRIVSMAYIKKPWLSL